jgi:hypothetical protein
LKGWASSLLQGGKHVAEDPLHRLTVVPCWDGFNRENVMRLTNFVATLLLSAGRAFSQEATPVSQPEVKVGETWTYVQMDFYSKTPRGEWLFEVVAVDDTSIKTDLKRDGGISSRTYGRDWSISKDFSLFNFPLDIGKKWASKTSYESPECGRATDELIAEVKGWEDVEVPAGKFRALRIEHNGNYTGPRCGSGRKNWWYWYAPSIKRFVRYEQRAYTPQGQLGFSQILELKAWKTQ